MTDSENKLNNHNHDKYIDTSEFNTLATNVFNTRLSQPNLQREVFMLNYQVLTEKLLQINRSINLL